MYHERFSASGLKRYLDCEFKYYMRYNLKLKDKFGFKAQMGTVAHRVLQIYGYLKRRGTSLDKRKLRKLIRRKIKEFRLFDVMMSDEKLKLEDRLTEKEIEQAVVSFVYAVIDRPTNNPMDKKILGLQHSFDVQVTREGYDDTFRLIGFIDLVVQRDAQTIQLIDYKTGKHVNSWKTVDDDLQGRIYDYAASIVFPQYKYHIVTFENIAPKKKSVSTIFTEAQRRAFGEYLFDLMFQIKHNHNPHPIRQDYHYLHFKCKYLCDNVLCKRVLGRFKKFGYVPPRERLNGDTEWARYLAGNKRLGQISYV